MNTTGINTEAQTGAEDQLAPAMQGLEVGTAPAPARRKRKPSGAAEMQTEGSVAAPSRPREAGGGTKADIVLKLLRRAKGASLAELTEATGWQAHSVRGFLSGTVKKKLGLAPISEKGKDGQHRYRVDAKAEAR